MARPRSGSRVRQLILVCARLTTEPTAPSLEDWTPGDWRHALADLPLDSGAFYDRFVTDAADVVAALRKWWRSNPGSPLAGYLGLVMLTLIGLRYSESTRMGTRDTHDCAADCGRLVADPRVRAAIETVYRPGMLPAGVKHPDGRGFDIEDETEPAPDPSSASLLSAQWKALSGNTFGFHRHGTTSVILTVKDADGAVQSALKCLLYPFLRIPAIARATADYKTDTTPKGGHRLDHVGGVRASADSWILMDFVPGVQLDEHLRDRRGGAPGLDLDLLKEIGSSLLTALDELDRAGLRHGDLSMSNILVNTVGGNTSIKLIDLGPNYLHTHRIPGRGDGGPFAAPELAADRRNVGKADLYSVGQLLIRVGTGANTPDGTVPDAFYVEAPLIARFLEDLVDRDPAKRLIVINPDWAPAPRIPGPRGPDGPDESNADGGRSGPREASPEDVTRYQHLRDFLVSEIEIVKETRRNGRAGPHSPWYEHLRELIRPLSGVPAEQRRLWAAYRERRSPLRDEAGLGRLRKWSMVSAYAFMLSATVIVMYWTRDIGFSWDTRLINAIQNLTGSTRDTLPFFDTIRSYPADDPLGSLPERLVVLSFAFAGAKHYQNVVAGIMPLIASRSDRPLRRWAIAAEAGMRMMTLVPFVLCMSPTLFDRDWWPICTALGITSAFVCNFVCAGFSQLALKRAVEAGLTTVPRVAGDERTPEVYGARAIRGWASTAAFYALNCWWIGLLIYFGVLKDVLVYAGAVTLINLVLFYVIRCGLDAPRVRTGLLRACLAAERTRRLGEIASTPVPDGRA